MSDAGNPGTVSGYVWKARGADLAPAVVADLKKMMLDGTSYDFDMAKKCVMVPEFALRLHAGLRHLDVLISFSCNTWTFQVGRDGRLEDFDPVAGRMKAIVETVFRMD